MAKKHGMNLSIEFDGLDAMIAEFDNMIDSIDDRIEDGLNEYALLVEEGSQELAPHDSGDLETEGINAEKAKWSGGIIEASVGANSEYALRRHEEPYKPGVRDKYDDGLKEEGYYVDGRGRRTRQKPAWRGEEPGRKFISRAVEATEKDFDEIMGNALDDVLRGRRR